MNRDAEIRNALPATARYDEPTRGTGSVDEFELREPPERLDRVGQYRLTAEIARGGMGVVFKAYDEKLHRDVAVKLLQQRFRDDAALCQRFENEALLTSRLQHPCIVPIYDCGQADDNRPYFAMKLIDGKALGDVLSIVPQSQLDRSRLLKIFEQVCQALAYAHSQGALHLDLKPANIMIGSFGEVHAMDWGLARMWSQPALEEMNNVLHSSVIKAVSVFGTAAYMSPEQARGEQLCPRTDIFGLGALLCEILTGRPPYRGRSHRGVHARAMRGKLQGAIARLDASNSDQRLVNLVKQCLSPDRNERPASPLEVAQVIGNYLETALEQAESDLCRFFDLSLDLFCIATMDGYLQRVNSNFPRVLGYDTRKLVSQPFLDFVHPDDVADTMRVMEDLTNGKPVVRFRNRYRHDDGHFIQLEWTAQAILDEGHIFAVARDVS